MAAVVSDGTQGDTVARLVSYAVAEGLIDAADYRWAYNSVLAEVGATEPEEVQAAQDEGAVEPPEAACEVDGTRARFLSPKDRFFPDCLLHPLAQIAYRRGALTEPPDCASAFERFSAQLMGRLMPSPSSVAREFSRCEREGFAAATDWFYHLCCSAGYVRSSAIACNVRWRADTAWGSMEITINLSKPEKDPRDIAAAAGSPIDGFSASDRGGERTPSAVRAPSGMYPRCRLCAENEGYAGWPSTTDGREWPPRQNLRIVPLTLGGEQWGMQYSPYAYFDEHCIVLNRRHVPMHVDRENMARLLEFVQRFPHYFLGSNADLPIVGGSILSHDHFQGGRHVFPLMEAPVVRRVPWPAHAGVAAGVVRWPVSVIRLKSSDAAALLDAADAVMRTWRDYRDLRAGIVPFDADGTRHNTVTPIAYLRNGELVLDLALRCNITSKDHPLGVFHPHEERHHIKKENVGLIEVMGLAILPPRLKREMAAVAKALSPAYAAPALDADPLLSPHAAWARQVAARHDFAFEDVHAVLRQEMGAVFAQVLEDVGVFKWDAAGRSAQDAFLRTLVDPASPYGCR